MTSEAYFRRAVFMPIVVPTVAGVHPCQTTRGRTFAM